MCVLALLAFQPTGWDLARQRVFADRFNRFSAELRVWAQTYNAGKYDLRGARRLSRLWREIEQSGSWPEPERKCY
jgi:hypothetical protein